MSIVSYRKSIYVLVLYHAIFVTISFYNYFHYPGDVATYWQHNPQLYSWHQLISPGTNLIRLICYPFASILKLPIWTGFLFFGLIGWYAIYRFWRFMNAFLDYKYKFLAFVLALLPSLHYWNSLIGKEPICFLLTVLSIENLFKKKSSHFLFFSMCHAMIRPHYAFILILSYLLTLLFDKKLKPQYKITAVAVFSLLGMLFYNLLDRITNLKPDPISALSRIYNRHIEVFRETDAYVPLDQYALPYKIFTFYFRPFPWEKIRWDYVAAGFENMVLLVLFLYGLFIWLKERKWKNLDQRDFFIIIYFFIFATVFAYAYANFGIILRTKIMALPFFYLFFYRCRTTCRKLE